MEANTTIIQAPDTTPPEAATATTSHPPRIRRRKRRGKDARERRRWIRLVRAALEAHEPPYCQGIDVPRRFVADIARWLGRSDILVHVRDTNIEEYRTLTIWHRTRFDPIALAAAIDADLDDADLAEVRAARRIGRPHGSRNIPRPWGATA
ncbi:MAG: hypothetical protein ACXVCO_17240 [Ktedonobacterales bacterium]